MNKPLLTTVLALTFGASSGAVGYVVNNNYKNADIKQLNTKIEQAETVNAEQKEQINTINVIYQETAKSNTKLEQENESLKKKNDDYSKANEDLKTENEQLKSTNSQLTENNQQLAEDKNSLSSKNEELVASNSDLKNQVSNSLTAYTGKRYRLGTDKGYAADSGFYFIFDGSQITAMDAIYNVNRCVDSNCNDFELCVDSEGNKYFAFYNKEDSSFVPYYLEYGSSYFKKLFADYSDCTTFKYLGNGNYYAQDGDGFLKHVIYKGSDKKYIDLDEESVYVWRTLPDGNLLLYRNYGESDQQLCIYDVETETFKEVAHGTNAPNPGAIFDYDSSANKLTYYSKYLLDFVQFEKYAGYTEQASVLVETDKYVIFKDTNGLRVADLQAGQITELNQITCGDSTVALSNVGTAIHLTGSKFLVANSTGSSCDIYEVDFETGVWSLLGNVNNRLNILQKAETESKILITFGCDSYWLFDKTTGEYAKFKRTDNDYVTLEHFVVVNNKILFISKNVKSKCYFGLIDVDNGTLASYCAFTTWCSIEDKGNNCFEISNNSNMFSIFDLNTLSVKNYIQF